MTNAHTARDWSLKGLGGESKPWPSISSRSRHCREGIRVRHRYRQHVRVLGLGWWTLFHGLGDGLSTMLAIARNNFQSMLDGFHEMDEHVRPHRSSATCLFSWAF